MVYLNSLMFFLKKLGPIEVSINRTFRGPSLARTIKLTETPVLVTSPSHFDALTDVATELDNLATLIVTSGKEQAQKLFPDLEIIDFHSLLSDNDTHIANTAHDLSTASIMFTSGTT